MSAVATPAPVDPKAARRRALVLVFFCTICGAAAQVLMKTGANNLDHAGLTGMITNMPLMAGYALYGISTVLLVAALREGELSLLYPIIGLTYVWVTILSFVLFKETISPYKLAGIACIVVGVGVLGRGSHR